MNEAKPLEEATECPLVAGPTQRQERATGLDWEAGHSCHGNLLDWWPCRVSGNRPGLSRVTGYRFSGKAEVAVSQQLLYWKAVGGDTAGLREGH